MPINKAIQWFRDSVKRGSILIIFLIYIVTLLAVPPVLWGYSKWMTYWWSN